MAETITGEQVADAMRRACRALQGQSDYLTTLDQAMGDGDMGITMQRIGDALLAYADATPTDDIGKFLGSAGMAANRAGSSTMGTLLATALMRAGKAAMGKSTLSPEDLVAMFQAAAQGMQERGKANLGDKTVLDALFPANEAFAAAINDGASVEAAGRQALAAAEAGRDRVTPLRSKIGRASWVGERTEGQPDPGCSALVAILRGLAGG